MKAGREIDALIAEKVMGWRVVGPHPIFEGIVFATEKNDTLAPYFSSSISAAWDVIEKMQSAGFVWEVASCIPQTLPPFGAGFIPRHLTVKEYEENRNLLDLACTLADTAPLAICLAALKAIGVEVALDA